MGGPPFGGHPFLQSTITQSRFFLDLSSTATSWPTISLRGMVTGATTREQRSDQDDHKYDDHNRIQEMLSSIFEVGSERGFQTGKK